MAADVAQATIPRLLAPANNSPLVEFIRNPRECVKKRHTVPFSPLPARNVPPLPRIAGALIAKDRLRYPCSARDPSSSVSCRNSISRDDVLIDPSLAPYSIRRQRDARRRDHGDRQNHGGRGITADTCHGYLPSRIALGAVITFRLPRSGFIPRKSRNQWAS